MSKKAKGRTFFIVSSAIIAMCIGVFIYRYTVVTGEIKTSQEKVVLLQSELDALSVQEAALTSDLEFSMTDAFKERIARDELGYVKKGELKFVAGSTDEAQMDDTEEADDE